MAEEKKEEKKLIIDDDWKQEAQKEKEVLATQEDDKKEEGPKKGGRSGPLPKGDFPALLSMLVTQAFFAMGMLEVKGQQNEPDFELAKYNIDILETLEEKTKGNLTDEEAKILENMLGQLRMAYVEATK